METVLFSDQNGLQIWEDGLRLTALGQGLCFASSPWNDPRVGEPIALIVMFNIDIPVVGLLCLLAQLNKVSYTVQVDLRSERETAPMSASDDFQLGIRPSFCPR